MKREQNYKTIFSDIDGTLIEQVRFEDLNPNEVNVLPGVKEKMSEWYEAGHYIVLTTARPENLREVTIHQMAIAGIRYHQLVMGIGREERILINNNSKGEPTKARAMAVAVGRDAGFTNSDWESVGL
jgi:predicted mannosyl-3-phosphoglycerate phosphatase (HAD superfamily)